MLATVGCLGTALMLTLVLIAASLGGALAERSGPVVPSPTTSHVAPTGTSPSPPPRRHPTDVAYANDSYRVPPARSGPISQPWPSSVADAKVRAKNNPLYRRSIASPVRCPYDPIVQDFGESMAHLREGADRYITCLMRVWYSAAGGKLLRRPNLVLYGTPPPSACGVTTGQFAGFYCSGDATIYLDARTTPYRNELDQWAFRFEYLIAHEFAHHIQATFGILRADAYLRNRRVGDVLEWERRRELQAECLQAVAWTSTSLSMGGTTADSRLMVALARQTGDHPKRAGSRGKSESRVLWVTRGLTAKSPRACNTYAAPAAEVR